MKKKNSISDFDREKRAFLLRNFREAIARQSVIDKNKAFHITAQSPTPRFWVSETRAAEVVGKLLAGSDPFARMLPEKIEMYREIFDRFMSLRKNRKDASIAELIFEIVNDEAPRSYLTWQTVRSIVYREQRRIREERRNNGWK